jgi:hypothetical protein
MSSVHLALDSRGHAMGCPHYVVAKQPAEGCGSYMDFYCECHTWETPLVLAGTTNVAWPAGWTPEKAMAWRAQNTLAAPVPT